MSLPLVIVTFPHLYLEKPVSLEVMAAKRRRGICVMHRCRRVCIPHKTRCHTCDSRLKRLRNPLYYAFENLKRSARKRGIDFLLTREEFKEFCDQYGYLEKKGKEPHSLTIDRRDKNGPYSKDNIRPMAYLDNISHKFENGEACKPDYGYGYDPSDPI